MRHLEFGTRGFAASTRREFLSISAAGLLFGAAPRGAGAIQGERDFKLALNQRSLHRGFSEGKIDPVDFAAVARKEFGIDAVEYVSSYFSARLGDEGYVNRLNKCAAENGVRQVLVFEFFQLR